MERNAGTIALSLVTVIALFIVVIFTLNATAALVITPRINWTVDTNRGANMSHSIGNLAFDNSYPTGGEAITLSEFGIFDTSLDLLLISGGCQGYIFQFDWLKMNLQVYYSDDNDTVDGPLIEVPNTGDLSVIDDALYEAIGW